MWKQLAIVAIVFLSFAVPSLADTFNSIATRNVETSFGDALTDSENNNLTFFTPRLMPTLLSKTAMGFDFIPTQPIVSIRIQLTGDGGGLTCTAPQQGFQHTYNKTWGNATVVGFNFSNFLVPSVGLNFTPVVAIGQTEFGTMMNTAGTASARLIDLDDPDGNLTGVPNTLFLYDLYKNGTSTIITQDLICNEAGVDNFGRKLSINDNNTIATKPQLIIEQAPTVRSNTTRSGINFRYFMYDYETKLPEC